MGFLPAFAIGVFAALITDFLPIHALRYTPRDQWPEWVTRKSYWWLSVAGFAIGGAVAGAYSTTTDMTWYVAANVGAAWPSIINGVSNAKSPLKAKPGTSD
jgi:hypothetical protein